MSGVEESESVAAKADESPERRNMAWQIENAAKSLKLAFDRFLTAYKNEPVTGSWLSPSAWTTSIDIHGYRARQVKILESLDVKLRSSPDPKNNFLKYLAVCDLVGMIHQKITHVSGGTFASHYDAYECEVMICLNHLGMAEDAKLIRALIRFNLSVWCDLKGEGAASAGGSDVPEKSMGLPQLSAMGMEPLFSLVDQAARMLTDYLESDSSWILDQALQKKFDMMFNALVENFSYEKLLDRWTVLAKIANERYPACFFDAGCPSKEIKPENFLEVQRVFESYLLKINPSVILSLDDLDRFKSEALADLKLKASSFGALSPK